MNKANVRDLIAVTGLVILVKLDSNQLFFSPCDLEIWRLTWKRNRAPLLYYIKLCASFQIHWWIQAGVTVRNRSIRAKISDFLSVWPWNMVDNIENQQGTSSILCQAWCIISKPSVNSNFSYSPKTLNPSQIWRFSSCVTLKFDGSPLQNNMAPLLTSMLLQAWCIVS